MASQLQAAGAQPQKPVRFSALHTGRFFQGLYTNRSPLRMGNMSWIYEKYYGGMNDALIGGLNVEVTPRLTLSRRPGNSIFTNLADQDSASFDAPDRIKEFRLFNANTEAIDVMVDTASVLYDDLVAKNTVFTKTAGADQSYMQSVTNTLFFSDGIDQKKWLQSLGLNGTAWPADNWQSNLVLQPASYPTFETFIFDSNKNMQQLIGAIAGIVSVALTGTGSGTTATTTGTITLTSGQGASTGVTIGQSIWLYLMSDTALDGLTATVTAVSTDTLTVTITGANVTTSSSTGHAIFMDSGLVVTPKTGGSEPSWATVVLTPSTSWSASGYPSNVLTIDGTALWICRSATTLSQAAGIFNWGIAAPTLQLAKLSATGGTSPWQANTFYSLDGVIIDGTHGNIQQVTTAGKTGASDPGAGWGNTVGATTTSGTAVFTTLQLAAALVWSGHSIYAPGAYIVASAGGQNCLFQLLPDTTLPQIIQQPAVAQSNTATGDYVNTYYWDTSAVGNPGVWTWDGTNYTGATSGNATDHEKMNSVLFNIGPAGADPNVKPMVNFVLSQSGEIASTNVPYSGATQRYSAAILFSLYIPAAGSYSLSIPHDDGMMFGIDGGATLVSGPTTDLESTTALNGYTMLGGINQNGFQTDSYIVNFPAAGQFNVEIDYFNWEDQQTLSLQIQGYTPAPTTGPFTLTSVDTGTGVYHGNIPNSAAISTAVGQTFKVTGFSTAANNGTFKCTAVSSGSSGTITLANTGSVSESHAATAQCVSLEALVAAPSWTAWGTSAAAYNATTMTLTFLNTTEQSTYSGPNGVYSPTGGYLTWANHGPASDFVWHASTNFETPFPAGTGIIDNNGNIQGPYRTGVSGSTQPTFSTTLNALTTDGATLTWINEGAATIAQAGTFSAANGGYQYGVALVNSLDDTASNLSPLSPATGNFLNASYVQIPAGYGLPPAAQIDPQADYVAIFRTTDGEGVPFLIPAGSVPNTFAAYTGATLPLQEYLANGYQDSTPDAGLNNLISAPVAGENTPPPPGAKGLVQHLGRLFFFVGGTVYWTSGPDTPFGNGFNGVAPDNFDEVSSLAKRLVPTATGLLVLTVSDVLIIQGLGTASSPIQDALPFLEGTGLLSYNAMDQNGSIIGLFTSDSTFMTIDPGSGFVGVGHPIANLLDQNNGNLGTSWNPANVYVAWHKAGEDSAWYLADGSTGWYRGNPTPAPESGSFAWSTFAQVNGGDCGSVQSVETSPGVHNLLIGSTSSNPVLTRDLSSWTDEGGSYLSYADIGSIVLAQAGQQAEVQFVALESVRIGVPARLGVLFDEAEPYWTGAFDTIDEFISDPPTIPASRTVYAQRFYMSEDTELTAICKNMQIRIIWGLDQVQNEVATYTIWGGLLQEQ